MKKLLSLILAVTLVLSAFALVGCGGEKDKINVKYYQEGSDVVAGLKSGVEEIGLVPEPAASMLEKQTPDVTWYRLDVQELYDSDTKAYPQAVLMVKSDLLNAYPELVTYISGKISDNVTWAKGNPASAVNAIKDKYPSTTLKAPMLSEKSIDGCKIYFQSAVEAKQSVEKYIDDIRSIDDTSANEVGDEFFYNPSKKNGTWDKDSISFYAPDGAPAISIAKFINDNDSLGTDKMVNYNVVNSTEIVGKMAQGAGDIILMPINGATKKYNADANQNNPYKLVSVITHGNFYLMSKTQLKFEDLIGKRVAVPNMGKVPDWTFRVIVNDNNCEVNVVD